MPEGQQFPGLSEDDGMLRYSEYALKIAIFQLADLLASNLNPYHPRAAFIQGLEGKKATSI